MVLRVLLPQLGKSKDKNASLVYWGIREESETMKPIISEFEKENPNIKVEYIKQDAKDYKEKLVTRIKNGNGPDIFKFHNTWYPMLYDVLLPLPQETIEKKEFMDSYYSVAQKDLTKNGAIIGSPLEIDTLALYINTKIFEDASREQSSTISIPTTWQEFIDSSFKLTKRDDSGKILISGAGIGTFDNVNHAPDIISLLFVQNAVDFNDLENSKTQAADALSFYTNFSLVENSVWDQTLDPSLNAFTQGKLAMYFGYSADYFAIKQANPNMSIRVVPVPQLLTDKRVNIASYFAEGVSSNSKNQKEALLFMKYLAKPETQKKLYEAESKIRSFGQPYGNKKLAEELRGTDAFVFVDQAKTAVSSPFVDGTYSDLNDKLNNSLKEAVLYTLGEGSAESATSALFESYFQITGGYSPKPTK